MVYYSGLFLNNSLSRLTVLLAHIVSIFSFTIPILILFILKLSLKASFIVWKAQGIKMESQNRETISRIASIIQISLGSKRCNCHYWFILTGLKHLQPAKLKSTFSWLWLPASRWKLINAILKPCLHLLLLVGLYKLLLLFKLYVPRARNRQKGYVSLVDIQS